MSHTIDQFGFEPCEEIPVKENDWAALVEAFVAGPAKIAKKEFDPGKASNVAGAIRKAVDKLGLAGDVTVTNDGGVIYLSKA